MNEREVRKRTLCQEELASAHRASQDYYAAHGGEDTTTAERATYERMVLEAQRAAQEHNETK